MFNPFPKKPLPTPLPTNNKDPNIPKDLYDAKFAQSITKKNFQKKYRSQMLSEWSYIKERIYEKIDKGHFNALISIKYKENIENLKSLGYTLEQSQLTDMYYISWDNK